MCKNLSNFSISCLHRPVLAWIMITVFCFSFLPSVSLAQQPTATITTLSGDVLVSGQTAAVGTVLQTGDTIQTQAGASVVLELSDGSTLELGESTSPDMAALRQEPSGTRVSKIELLWGRIRAKLSSRHQTARSSFDIETPNALIGVKFSEPDIEVSYSQDTLETIGIAHTVQLMAKNLLTDEAVLVPVGSSVIIVGTAVKIVAGMLTMAGATEAGTAGAGATGTTSTATTSTATAEGMGTGTKVAIGVGAAAAVGGVAAIVASSGSGAGDNSGTTLFTGPFKYEEDKINQVTSRPESWTGILNLTQNETTITGDQVVIGAWENCCSVTPQLISLLKISPIWKNNLERVFRFKRYYSRGSCGRSQHGS